SQRRIKGCGELLIAIPNEEPERFRGISECPRQLPRLLCHPGRRRRRRTAGEVHAATPQFDAEEHVQPLQPDGLDREEINRQQTLTVHADKLAPGRSPSSADSPETRLLQPSTHRRWRDAHPETFQLADDPLVTPSRVFARETQGKRPDITPNRPATTSACVRPAFRDQVSMPAEQRRGRDEERVPAGARGQPTGGSQQEPVDWCDCRSTHPPPQDCELVSQDQDLQLLEVV